jgi:hypothetical protein
MNDGLRVSINDGIRYIPNSDPYTYNSDYSDKFLRVGDGLKTYFQNVQDPIEMFSDKGNQSIVDWIFVELRNKNNFFEVLGTRSVLLRRDGSVVDIDGSLDIKFQSLPNDDYFVSIRHRNHLGVMTGDKIDRLYFSANGSVLDFSTMTSDKLFNLAGFDGLEMATLPDGKKALWAGDLDGNLKVKYQGVANDRTLLLANVQKLSTNVNYNLGFGYFMGDLNMDSKVKYQGTSNDRTILQNIVLGHPLNNTFRINYDLFEANFPKR